MSQKSNQGYSWIIIIVTAVFMNFAFSTGIAHSQTDTTYLHYIKSKAIKNSFKNSLHLVLPPFKPAFISTTKILVAKPDDKVLSNVQVYPNPVTVTDLINIKYELSRSSNVTIKILDVLGNDIITPFSQRVEPGEISYRYPISNKLTRGFYFLRIVAGNESVIKRISVL